MTPVPSFSSSAIEQIALAVGEAITTNDVFELLVELGIAQAETFTKWRVIKSALVQEQTRVGNGECVLRLVENMLAPQRWANQADAFHGLRSQINGVLVFNGLEVGPDGRCVPRAVARTHDEAASATSHILITELERRGAHAEIFRYCQAELVAEDCFTAVFEATKGLAERVRQMSGLDLDGHKLVEGALEGTNPAIRLNEFQSDTQKNEQRGIAHLMRGAFSAFRNPLGHEPKVLWHIPTQDALDLLTTLSLIHRRLDGATFTGSGDTQSSLNFLPTPSYPH